MSSYLLTTREVRAEESSKHKKVASALLLLTVELNMAFYAYISLSHWDCSSGGARTLFFKIMIQVLGEVYTTLRAVSSRAPHVGNVRVPQSSHE